MGFEFDSSFIVYILKNLSKSIRSFAVIMKFMNKIAYPALCTFIQSQYRLLIAAMKVILLFFDNLVGRGSWNLILYTNWWDRKRVRLILGDNLPNLGRSQLWVSHTVLKGSCIDTSNSQILFISFPLYLLIWINSLMLLLIMNFQVPAGLSYGISDFLNYYLQSLSHQISFQYVSKFFHFLWLYHSAFDSFESLPYYRAWQQLFGCQSQ